MEQNVINPKASLNSVIEVLEKDLKTYQNSTHPLSYIIDKKKNVINQLKAINTEIEFFRNNNLMKVLHEELERLMSIDKEIERISFNIDIKPFTNKQSTVNVQYYA